MGFPSVYPCIFLPKPLGVLLYFFLCIKFTISLFVAYIGLSSAVEVRDFVYVELDLYLFPSLWKVDSPSTIKSMLRIVEFERFCEGSAKSGGGEDAAECAVCMGELKARHEVRELRNCSHAFHRGCIDKWVDVGQVSCPLCRAHLLPQERVERGLTCYM